MAKKKQKFLILPNGTEEPVLKETGKFYVCKERMFRKSNDTVLVKLHEPDKDRISSTKESKGGEE